MKIAQIAPLFESCPPRLYGGTERIVSYLTEELVRQGHDVTLFASGNSRTSARLVPFCETALRLDPRVKDPIPHHIVMLDRVRALADEFDVLHFHVDVLHYPLIRSFADKTVTTLHGRLDLPELKGSIPTFAHVPLVSISSDQRRPMPPVNWVGTVHHGLPRTCCLSALRPRGDYLAFLGRISPEKGPAQAIEIATRAGRRLKMAAKIDRVDQAYWEEVIKPLVDAHPNVEFVGEINEREKAQVSRRRRGAPVPDRLAGAVRHRDDRSHGLRHARHRLSAGARRPRSSTTAVSGYLVDDVEEAVAAVRRIRAFRPEAGAGLFRAALHHRPRRPRLRRTSIATLPGVRIAAPRVRFATGWGSPVAPTSSVFDEHPRARAPSPRLRCMRFADASADAPSADAPRSVDRQNADRSPPVEHVDDDVPARAAKGDVGAAACHAQPPQDDLVQKAGSIGSRKMTRCASVSKARPAQDWRR